MPSSVQNNLLNNNFFYKCHNQFEKDAFEPFGTKCAHKEKNDERHVGGGS